MKNVPIRKKMQKAVSGAGIRITAGFTTTNMFFVHFDGTFHGIKPPLGSFKTPAGDEP